MNSYIEKILARVEERDGDKKEFLQCVREVYGSLEKVIEAHPEYEKYDILILGCGSLKTYLAGFTPIAPKNAVFGKDVTVAVICVRVDALNNDCVIEGVDKAVSDYDVAAVHHIDTIGIVPPLTEDVYAVDNDIFAVEEIYTP